MIYINEIKAANLNLSGKGGKEKQIKEIFTTPAKPSIRINAPLFDIIQGENRIELKKQGNTQWFDIGKYHNLKSEDRDILMTFILTSRGRKSDPCKAGFIEKIFSIKLGEMLDILTANETYKIWGWTFENIETCYNQKKKYPTQQAKVKIEVRNFFNDNINKFNIIWERQISIPWE